MPADLFTRLDLDLIWPPFLARILDAAAAAKDAGARYVAIAGHRTFATQMALWAQGRTRPGRIVTHAKGGYSLHNYGLAVDFARDADVATAGLQPDWAATAYGPLRTAGEAQGLQVGVPNILGGDLGHVQVPVARLDTEMAVLRALKAAHDRGGLPAAWVLLDGWAVWGPP